MDLLNNCQLRIIKYLSLNDQLKLYEAVKETHLNRFCLNLRYSWQHQLNFNLDTSHFSYFVKNPELMHDFLSIVSSTVRQLDLHKIPLKMLKSWTRYNFSKMRSLEYQVDFNYEDSKLYWNESNQVIQLMSKLFPGLTEIKPWGQFNVIHLANWMDMRKLDLIGSTPISVSSEGIDGMAGFQKIEELILNSEYLSKEHFKSLLCLPKLQTLYPGVLDDRKSCVFEMRAKDIEKIVVNHYYSKRLSLVKFCINLRQVIIYGLSPKIKFGELEDLITTLPLLERLDIVNALNWSSESELWQIVACCRFLKILSIPMFQVSNKFFVENRNLMEMVLNRRSTSLTLHFDDIGENRRLICSYFKHQKLNISFKRLEAAYYLCGLARFDFYPLKIGTTEEVK